MHNSRPRVLCLGWPTEPAVLSDLKELAEIAHVDSIPYQPRADMIRAIERHAEENGPYIATMLFFSPELGMVGPCDAELLKALGPGCKLYTGPGAGYDKVDTAWMSRMGASYANSPSAVAEPTGHATCMLILMALRGMSANEMSARAGNWLGKRKFGQVLGEDSRGKVLGLVGMGSIAKVVARGMSVFGMEIHYYCRRQVTDAPANYIYHSTLESLLAVTDVLSLHCPLTAETRHLIGDAELTIMKKGSFVVNTSRGAVVNEAALVRALKSRHIARAALDVFEHEPQIHPFLLKCPRVTLSPHCAAMTRSAPIGMDREIIENVRQFLYGEDVRNAVTGPLSMFQDV